MPFDKDSQGGGSNIDGSKNSTYCSYCYQNGKFTFETNDVKIFQTHCRKMMKKNQE